MSLVHQLLKARIAKETMQGQEGWVRLAELLWQYQREIVLKGKTTVGLHPSPRVRGYTAQHVLIDDANMMRDVFGPAAIHAAVAMLNPNAAEIERRVALQYLLQEQAYGRARTPLPKQVQLQEAPRPNRAERRRAAKKAGTGWRKQ